MAGYVGADHVSMLLASGALHASRPVIALDIGTNTEISLVIGEQIWSCSCASGPAFEGAHIRDGMRAAPGAIERVKLLEGKLAVYTIGERPPVGICGSGILDAVASLLEAGAVDSRGNLIKGHPLAQVGDGKREALLASASETGSGREVAVTRKDINEIQLAKGAIRAGIEVLLAEAGISAQDLDRLVVAGAFGTYLDLESALRVGMFPNLPVERIEQIGNAAGAGARQMLVSKRQRAEAEQIAQQAEYIELTIHPSFTEAFYQAILKQNKWLPAR